MKFGKGLAVVLAVVAVAAGVPVLVSAVRDAADGYRPQPQRWRLLREAWERSHLDVRFTIYD